MNRMNRSDSEKEIAIYEGVRKLIRQDVNLSQVTASEIAQAAGIGKGTLYNYFSTKDEIIARTVFYLIDQHLAQIQTVMARQTGFEGKCRAAMEFIRLQAGRKDSQIHLMLMGLDSVQAAPFLRQGMERIKATMRDVERIALELAETGAAEGVITRQEPGYTVQVFLSALMGYCRCLCGAGEGTDGIPAAERAYRMLIKALN